MICKQCGILATLLDAAGLCPTCKRELEQKINFMQRSELQIRNLETVTIPGVPENFTSFKTTTKVPSWDANHQRRFDMVRSLSTTVRLRRESVFEIPEEQLLKAVKVVIQMADMYLAELDKEQDGK